MSTPTAAFQAAVIAALRADVALTALVGANGVAASLRESTVNPRVIYMLERFDLIETSGAGRGYRVAPVQISVVTDGERGRVLAKVIAEAVIAALHQQDLPMSAGYCEYMHFRSMNTISTGPTGTHIAIDFEAQIYISA
ncbi:MAG TPA: hypothetical protein DDW89_11025 [Gammaproteobacteria bacterium]|nr:hypothetical protein [Gammaproteobacteria bacterium]